MVPALLPPRQKWLGVPVDEIHGTLDEITALIPRFTRQPFSLNTANGHPSKQNRFFDMIVREPHGESGEALPVGIVSKHYNFVQHITVLDHAVMAMKSVGIKADEVSADMKLTENGERMELHLHFPQRYSVEPSDGHSLGLRLVCFNSVDGSLKFSSMLGWFRFVCSNGLVIGTTESVEKQRHNSQLDVDMIRERLKRDLVAVTRDKKRFKKWIATAIRPETLCKWIDGDLRKEWGVKAAVRAFHIARTGHDAEIVLPFEKAPPSRREVKQGVKVPGASNGGLNAYAICQALSWLAKERRELQEHIERERQIEPLIERLIALN